MVVTKRRVLAGLSASIVLVATGWALLNVQLIIDWWRLRDYTPSSEIARIADDTGMSDHGRKLFYVHDPELLPIETFRKKCVFEEYSIVLGCYISHQRIYVYNVNDERLAGVEEVTAAHEMLHAAYDRLSLKDREYLDSLLLDFYADITDERLIRTIQTYQDKDSQVIPNELHSILGSEVRLLTPELESHYAQYFENRLEVVALAEAYAQEFTSRDLLIETYDKQLDELKGNIAVLEARLKEQSIVIDQERTRIEKLRNDPDSFQVEADAFNDRILLYNQTITELEKRIKEHNALVETRNAIAIEEQELIKAIDTSKRMIDQ